MRVVTILVLLLLVIPTSGPKECKYQLLDRGKPKKCRVVDWTCQQDPFCIKVGIGGVS